MIFLIPRNPFRNDLAVGINNLHFIRKLRPHTKKCLDWIKFDDMVNSHDIELHLYRNIRVLNHAIDNVFAGLLKVNSIKLTAILIHIVIMRVPFRKRKALARRRRKGCPTDIPTLLNDGVQN